MQHITDFTIENINNIIKENLTPASHYNSLERDIYDYCHKYNISAVTFHESIKTDLQMYPAGTFNTTCQICGFPSDTEICCHCEEFRSSKFTSNIPDKIVKTSHVGLGYLDANVLVPTCGYCGNTTRNTIRGRYTKRTCGACDLHVRLSKAGYNPSTNYLSSLQDAWLPKHVVTAVTIGGAKALLDYNKLVVQTLCATCSEPTGGARTCDECKKKARSVSSNISRKNVGSKAWERLVEYYVDCLKKNPRAAIPKGIKDHVAAETDQSTTNFVRQVLKTGRQESSDEDVKRITGIIGFMVLGVIEKTLNFRDIRTVLRIEEEELQMVIHPDIMDTLDRAIQRME